MAYPDWQIHGPETVAAYLPDQLFKGLFEKRLAFPPDCAAILIRDGKLVDAWQGAHFAVGGLWQRLKEAIGGPHSLRLLVADLKPFPVRVGLKAFTKDRVEVEAELALELQLNPEKPADVMGLMAGGRTLTRGDVYERLRPHLQERVLVHELVQHDAAHLRANRGLQDRLQAEIMKEAQRVLGDLGLLVRAASVNWGVTADEAQAIRRRDLERQEELREFEYARAKREVEREAEATTFRLAAAMGVEKAKAAGEGELQQLLLSGRLALEDARETGARVAEKKRLLHELELSRSRRLEEYDRRLGDEQNALERTKIELARKRLEMEFDADRRRQELELRKLEQLQELEVAGAGHGLQRQKLKDLQELELEKRRAEHDLGKDEALTRHALELERQAAASKAELERLKLQAAMSPDQLLALQAGLSPEVARVFAEKAKAGGVEREALLRELLELSKQGKADSEAQARAMFDKAVEGLAAVGAAGAGAAAGAGPGAPARGAVECPKCHHPCPVSDRFCRSCGHQLRT